MPELAACDMSTSDGTNGPRGRARQDGRRRLELDDAEMLLRGLERRLAVAEVAAGGVRSCDPSAGGAPGGPAARIEAARARLEAQAGSECDGGPEAAEETRMMSRTGDARAAARGRGGRARGDGHPHAQADGHGARTGASAGGRRRVCARGLTRVQYPGEEPRELERFEVEAILAVAAEGGVGLLVPFSPGLGHGGRPRWAPFQLEDGSIVGPDSERYPHRAIAGA